MSERIKILLVEDDPNLSLVLLDYLEMLGYEIKLCKDGEEGLKAFKRHRFDLCVFDVMMPKKDGFSLAEDIRATNQIIPIIFLTAKSLKEDRIKGFQLGCDDYITKPFSTEELSLRIRAILKRCQVIQETNNGTESNYQIGIFSFDSKNMTLRTSDLEYNLTRKESGLLKLLCLHKNKLLSREYALKMIWGENDYFIGRSMDVFIAKLRKYLKADPNISINNVHGTGFKLEVIEKAQEK
ncbi:MAG: response regulator transcription factor [Bacteroidetes bacterium]|nr:response regulator transcription factor [Bacteroidota bacterium]